MFAKLLDGGSSLLGWMGKHKILTGALALILMVLFINYFMGPTQQQSDANVAGEEQQGQVDVGAMLSTLVGFVEENGCWCYLDALDTGELENYAHEDLIDDLVDERIEPYITPEEAADPESAKALAVLRMQQLGIVTTSYINDLNVVSQTDASCQIEVEIVEHHFSFESGLEKVIVNYTLDMEKAKGVGVTAPYQVVRLLKN